MWHRMVSNLVTTSVVRVSRDTGFKEIAKLLAEYGITAVPVVDDDERPVGVVSEADLLRKEAAQLDPVGLLPVLRPRPTARAKAEAARADGLMNSPAVTARPQWTAVEAAQVMERHRVKRLPVVDEADRLVGIISRADLLRVSCAGTAPSDRRHLRDTGARCLTPRRTGDVSGTGVDRHDVPGSPVGPPGPGHRAARRAAVPMALAGEVDPGHPRSRRRAVQTVPARTGQGPRLPRRPRRRRVRRRVPCRRGRRPS
ncbi:CBS domain-containing protein [Streptomyces sp. NPDC006872]|uniref:CBS domain-containing protein n=1 Tax=Streptomyces sp. NPDC006872 TaxID=3155720 RepID=UPI0033FCE70A